MKSRAVAFWLAFFLGFFGVHRFYLGKVITGIIWFFTSALFTFGYIADLFFLAFGFTRDANGKELSEPGFFHALIIKIVCLLVVFAYVSIIAFIFYAIMHGINNFVPNKLPELLPAPVVL